MIVRAPGKLLVVGEYAVLDGAPAVVAAVDRGVQCEVLASPTLRIEVPAGDDRFVRAALEAVQAPPALYRFSDWNPVTELSSKAGFGGSAAAVVAACLAGGRLDEELAVEVHRRVQGSGSGVDVRASVNGGVRRYPGGLPLGCPPLSAIWSGRSARTGPRVTAYLAWSGRRDFAARSEELVHTFAENPVLALAEARALLAAMARESGVDWDTPELSRISALALDFGGAAKPSGAGGGDVAVAIIPDPESRAAFEAACAAEGLLPIPISVAEGARRIDAR